MRYGGATLLHRAAKNDWLPGLFLGLPSSNVEFSVDTAPVPVSSTTHHRHQRHVRTAGIFGIYKVSEAAQRLHSQLWRGTLPAWFT